MLWLVDTSDILKGLPLTTRTTDRSRGCGCKRSQVTRFVIVRFEQKERKARLDNSPLSHACLWYDHEWMMCVNVFFLNLFVTHFPLPSSKLCSLGPYCLWQLWAGCFSKELNRKHTIRQFWAWTLCRLLLWQDNDGSTMVGQDAVKNLQHVQRSSVILPQLRKNYVPVIYPKSFSQDEEPQFGAQPEEPWGSPEMNYALPPAIRAGQWPLSSEMSFECF